MLKSSKFLPTVAQSLFVRAVALVLLLLSPRLRPPTARLCPRPQAPLLARRRALPPTPTPLPPQADYPYGRRPLPAVRPAAPASSCLRRLIARREYPFIPAHCRGTSPGAAGGACERLPPRLRRGVVHCPPWSVERGGWGGGGALLCQCENIGTATPPLPFERGSESARRARLLPAAACAFKLATGAPPRTGLPSPPPRRLAVWQLRPDVLARGGSDGAACCWLVRQPAQAAPRSQP